MKIHEQPCFHGNLKGTALKIKKKHFLVISRVEKGISPGKKGETEPMIFFLFFSNHLHIVSVNANIPVRIAPELCLR